MHCSAIWTIFSHPLLFRPPPSSLYPPPLPCSVDVKRQYVDTASSGLRHHSGPVSIGTAPYLNDGRELTQYAHSPIVRSGLGIAIRWPLPRGRLTIPSLGSDGGSYADFDDIGRGC